MKKRVLGMETVNKFNFKYYKKRSKVIMIMYSVTSVLFCFQAVLYILQEKIFGAIVWGIAAITYSIRTIELIREQKNILIEPGLILDEESIKFRTYSSRKYKTINLREVINLEVPKYDDIITIHTVNKKYTLLLDEYDQEIRLELRDKFRELSLKIIN
jgi:hypothetical protein